MERYDWKPIGANPSPVQSRFVWGAVNIHLWFFIVKTILSIRIFTGEIRQFVLLLELLQKCDCSRRKFVSEVFISWFTLHHVLHLVQACSVLTHGFGAVLQDLAHPLVSTASWCFHLPKQIPLEIRASNIDALRKLAGQCWQTGGETRRLWLFEHGRRIMDRNTGLKCGCLVA